MPARASARLGTEESFNWLKPSLYLRDIDCEEMPWDAYSVIQETQVCSWCDYCNEKAFKATHLEENDFKNGLHSVRMRTYIYQYTYNKHSWMNVFCVSLGAPFGFINFALSEAVLMCSGKHSLFCIVSIWRISLRNARTRCFERRFLEGCSRYVSHEFWNGERNSRSFGLERWT